MFAEHSSTFSPPPNSIDSKKQVDKEKQYLLKKSRKEEEKLHTGEKEKGKSKNVNFMGGERH